MTLTKKRKSIFICQECGTVHNKWMGQCSGCQVWDRIVEEIEEVTSIKAMNATHKMASQLEYSTLNQEMTEPPRVKSTLEELDRVLGGGFVPGSAILIGGDPGIGKSTILLQIASDLANRGANVAYISGEESINQIRMRAKRLNKHNSPMQLANATMVNEIKALVKKANNPDILIIDSIQTVYIEELGSAPGTVGQVRACAHELISMAKKKDIILIMVGHVTKDGQIAGPRVLEHMVDTVLYFEGDKGNQFRILRTVKNRFGSTNEIGVFSMCDSGLEEILNPSSLFLSERRKSVSGSVIFAGMEGSRPVLVEIQALLAGTHLATPRRAVVGWDPNRLAMIIAVLQTRYGIFLADKEVYLNVVGGLKINEPAADLAVACALISAAKDRALPNDLVIFGEIGLSGEIRNVSHFETRLKEAQKLGFNSAYCPAFKGDLPHNLQNITINNIQHIREIEL